MKKIFVLIAAGVLAFSVNSSAQVASPNALGIRIGGSENDGVEAEISYQHGLGRNRLEFDLGFNSSGYYNSVKFSLLYHFVYPIGDGFYWYFGPGGAVGFWNIDDDKPFDDDFHRDEGIFLDASGQLGIEYQCNVPLQISLDVRPEIGIINDDFDLGAALGVRFRF